MAVPWFAQKTFPSHHYHHFGQKRSWVAPGAFHGSCSFASSALTKDSPRREARGAWRQRVQKKTDGNPRKSDGKAYGKTQKHDLLFLGLPWHAEQIDKSIANWFQTRLKNCGINGMFTLTSTTAIGRYTPWVGSIPSPGRHLKLLVLSRHPWYDGNCMQLYITMHGSIYANNISEYTNTKHMIAVQVLKWSQHVVMWQYQFVTQ